MAIDGKGDEDFAAGIIALNLTARPVARIGLLPATLRPLALVAGRVGRLPMGAWSFTRGRVLRQHRPARPPTGDLGPRPSADPVGRPAGRAARSGCIRGPVRSYPQQVDLCTPGGPHADPQQLMYHRLQLLVGLLLLAISLGGLVLLLALFT